MNTLINIEMMDWIFWITMAVSAAIFIAWLWWWITEIKDQLG